MSAEDLFLESTHARARQAGAEARSDSIDYIMPEFLRHATVTSGDNGLFTIRLIDANGQPNGNPITGVRCYPPDQILAINQTVLTHRYKDGHYIILGIIGPDDFILTGFALQGYQDLGFACTKD